MKPATRAATIPTTRSTRRTTSRTSTTCSRWALRSTCPPRRRSARSTSELNASVCRWSWSKGHDHCAFKPSLLLRNAAAVERPALRELGLHLLVLRAHADLRGRECVEDAIAHPHAVLGTQAGDDRLALLRDHVLGRQRGDG